MIGSDALATFKKASKLREENIPFVLCTIISKRGSSPRDPGTHMIVTEDSLFGTVGGGLAEYKAAEFARSMLNDTRIIDYCDYDLGMNNPDAVKTDMICTGLITVMFTKGSLLPDIASYVGEDGDSRSLYLVFDTENAEAGYSVITEEGLSEELKSISGTFHYDGRTVFEPVRSNPRVFVFGAGHVGCAVAKIMRFLGYDVIAADDRPEVINDPIRDTATRCVLVDWDSLDDNLDLKSSDYAVIMTNEHFNDEKALTYALRKQAFYIGCMGSKARSASNRNAMRKAGFSEYDVGRIHTPIGLSIGGRSPEEIALSVAAEITKTRYKTED